MSPPVYVRVLAFTVGASTCISLISPRTIPYTLSVVCLACLFALWREKRLNTSLLTAGPTEWTIAAFIGLCAVSMVWTAQPTAGIIPVVTAVACSLGCLIMMRTFQEVSPDNISHVARGMVWGFVFGVVYLLIEILTHQSIKIWVYNALSIPKSWLRPSLLFKWNGDKLVSILSVDLTRNIAPLTLMIWSALLIAVRRWSTREAWIIFSVAVVVIMISEHETSKVAIVWSVLVFLIAKYNSNWGQRLLQFAWVSACLAVIPLTLTLHRLDLHNSIFLQSSLRHRIIIWNHTAEETLKRPLLGIGAGMMYRLDPSGVSPEAGEEWSGASPHAHNAYLQTWFELGAAGAALLALIGLAILSRIQLIEDSARPFAHATFAACMAMAAASYGVWQAWFLALFEMSIVMCVIALRYSDTTKSALSNE